MKGTLQEIVHQQGLKHHIGELCPTCEYFEKVGHVPLISFQWCNSHKLSLHTGNLHI